MFTDYVENGVGHGAFGSQFAHYRFDTGLLRPIKEPGNREYFCFNTGKKDEDGKPVYKNEWRSVLDQRGVPVCNATGLRKDEWIMLDQVVLTETRTRLRAWDDLSSANTLGGFDGMANPILQWETSNKPGQAQVDMKGITQGSNDGAQYQLQSMPLPITHDDFFLDQRTLATSRNIGMSLDTFQAGEAARNVAEAIENTTIGTTAGMLYGLQPTGGQLSQVFGYTNHPNRLTNTSITVPTGANGTTTVSEVLGLINELQDIEQYGPYMIYHSTDWSQFMDDDYKADSDLTLRQRLQNIDNVMDVRRLDNLTNVFTLLIVTLDGKTARAVNGMDITTVRWEEKGGMLQNFKVMAIQAPNLRATFGDSIAIMQATTA